MRHVIDLTIDEVMNLAARAVVRDRLPRGNYNTSFRYTLTTDGKSAEVTQIQVMAIKDGDASGTIDQTSPE
jgi:hypothetical protein